MIPPARTAATTAAEVQLAAVPFPTTRVGCDVSTGPAPTGTETGLGADSASRSGVRATELAAGTTAAPKTATQKQEHRNEIPRRIAKA
jgi:hypothetical protein